MTGTTSTKLATFEEFEGLEELSLEGTEQVAGGFLPFLAWGAFALASIIGFGGAVARDQLSN